MVGGLELGRRDVAAGRVQTLLVPPGHPRRGRDLDLIGCSPGPLRPNELGLVEAVDGLLPVDAFDGVKGKRLR